MKKTISLFIFILLFLHVSIGQTFEVVKDIYLKANPDYYSDDLMMIPAGNIVKKDIASEYPFIRITYNGEVGYVSLNDLKIYIKPEKKTNTPEEPEEPEEPVELPVVETIPWLERLWFFRYILLAITGILLILLFWRILYKAAKEKAELRAGEEVIERKRLERERQAELEQRRERERQVELERQRREGERQAYLERQRLEREGQAELEQRRERERQAELESQRRERERQAELESQRLERERQAELESQRREKERQAELESQRREKERQEKEAETNPTINTPIIDKLSHSIREKLKRLKQAKYPQNEDLISSFGISFLYHMTHKSNLSSILKYGLLSHNDAHNRNLTTIDISENTVNDRRRRIEPIFNKSIHEYAPLYFNPKNPMLFKRKNIQNDIVILAYEANLLLKENTIFTDGNAASDSTNFYNNFDCLSKLSWECINDAWWNTYQDGKRKKCAEVLILNKIEIDSISKIITFDESTKNFVNSIKREVSINNPKLRNLKVEVDKKLYFND